MTFFHYRLGRGVTNSSSNVKRRRRLARPQSAERLCASRWIEVRASSETPAFETHSEVQHEGSADKRGSLLVCMDLLGRCPRDSTNPCCHLHDSDLFNLQNVRCFKEEFANGAKSLVDRTISASAV